MTEKSREKAKKVLFCLNKREHKLEMQLSGAGWVMSRILEVVQRSHDVSDAIELVIWIQNKNHAAYLSHRRKNISKRE